jgi:hypothetical protein
LTVDTDSIPVEADVDNVVTDVDKDVICEFCVKSALDEDIDSEIIAEEADVETVLIDVDKDVI